MLDNTFSNVLLCVKIHIIDKPLTTWEPARTCQMFFVYLHFIIIFLGEADVESTLRVSLQRRFKMLVVHLRKQIQVMSNFTVYFHISACAAFQLPLFIAVHSSLIQWKSAVVVSLHLKPHPEPLAPPLPCC